MLPLNLRFHLADLCLLLAGCSPGWTAVCTLQALELAVWVAWLCRCCRQSGGRLWLTLFALALELVRIWRPTPLFSCPDSKQKGPRKPRLFANLASNRALPQKFTKPIALPPIFRLMYVANRAYAVIAY